MAELGLAQTWKQPGSTIQELPAEHSADGRKAGSSGLPEVLGMCALFGSLLSGQD